MDDATARTRTLGRRMASAKPPAAPRRSGSSGSPRRGDEPRVSPARWAGVALVMAAILAATVLAIVSPSEPAASEQPGTLASVPSPTPAASPSDTRVPTAKPTIVSPGSGPTAEYEIALTVDVPKDDMPRKLLTLVVLRGDDELKELKRPRLGSKVTIEGVRLLERSDNELTVALESAAGRGPESASVLVTHDPDAPTLAITAPEDGIAVYSRTILVEGTSEVGAEVTIRNERGWGPFSQAVDSGGNFQETVKLKYGKNDIVVESQGQTATLSPPQVVRVTRLDGRPTLEVDVLPPKIKRSSLPGSIRVRVTVTDAKGNPMADATVAYSLGAATAASETYSQVTGPDGTSTWKPEVPWSSSLTEAIQLGLTVTSPHGDTVEEGYPIAFS